MDLDWDELPGMDDMPVRYVGGAHGKGQWGDCFVRHPEGGGPFGGRDNALTKLVGFLRAKSLPFEVALTFARWWNREYVDPPLDHRVVEDKVSRAWVEWLEGGMPDDTPDTAGQPQGNLIRFVGLDTLAIMASEAGNMEWLVEDLILAGGIHFITAPPGGGKTWAAIDLVRALTTGTRWLDHKKAMRCGVLYVNEEMGAAPFYQRLKDLGVESGGFHAIQREGIRIDSDVHLPQIVDYIRRNDIRVVVIDTFVRVHGKDENDNSQMAQLFGRFKTILDAGAAVVCLHHHRKASSTMGSPVAHEAMRGAGEIAAQADLVAAIEKTEDGYKFKVTKHRHLEEDSVPEFGFRIGKDAAGFTRIEQFELEMPQEVTTLANAGRSRRGGGNDLERQILSVLADSTRPLGLNVINSKVTGSKGKVSETLAKLCSEGLLAMVQEGQYHFYTLAN